MLYLNVIKIYEILTKQPITIQILYSIMIDPKIMIKYL
jgi:hypothetical protein